MSHSLRSRSKHLSRGQVDEPVQVRVVLPGELHQVDAGHGVVHHKVQRSLNTAVNISSSREMQDNLEDGRKI